MSFPSNSSESSSNSCGSSQKPTYKTTVDARRGDIVYNRGRVTHATVYVGTTEEVLADLCHVEKDQHRRLLRSRVAEYPGRQWFLHKLITGVFLDMVCKAFATNIIRVKRLYMSEAEYQRKVVPHLYRGVVEDPNEKYLLLWDNCYTFVQEVTGDDFGSNPWAENFCSLLA